MADKPWSRWAEHVFSELERFDKHCESSQKRLRELEREVYLLKWIVGAIGLVASSAIALAIERLLT